MMLPDKNEGVMKMIEKRLKEIRCRKCNRLLMKGDILKVEIKCPKCGHIQKIGENGAFEKKPVTSR